MIHEISPHLFDNQYQPKVSPSENDFILSYDGRSVLLNKENGSFELPRRKDFSEISDSVFLCTFDGVACFLVNDKLNVDGTGLSFQDIRFFRSTNQQEIAWVCLVGLHLKNWYDHNLFCGKCGGKTEHKADERGLVCHACKTTIYPRISPAVIVAITCNDKILLIRGNNFPGSWFSLVAGYVDVGEALEETVAREIKEEVGLDVKNIRYYKSQPWPLSGSMMIGFIAEADDSQPIVIDPKEIGEAAWFKRGELPEHSLNLSIAGEMIEKFDRAEL